MTAGEAVVFWLGGFSRDPKFPISGDGGPSYASFGMARHPADRIATLDPIESRKWVFPFDVTRLGPRMPTGISTSPTNRFIEYT